MDLTTSSTSLKHTLSVNILVQRIRRHVYENTCTLVVGVTEKVIAFVFVTISFVFFKIE
jgi:dihydroneopterin aldolase